MYNMFLDFFCTSVQELLFYFNNNNSYTKDVGDSICLSFLWLCLINLRKGESTFVLNMIHMLLGNIWRWTSWQTRKNPKIEQIVSSLPPKQIKLQDTHFPRPIKKSNQMAEKV